MTNPSALHIEAHRRGDLPETSGYCEACLCGVLEEIARMKME